MHNRPGSLQMSATMWQIELACWRSSCHHNGYQYYFEVQVLSSKFITILIISNTKWNTKAQHCIILGPTRPSLYWRSYRGIHSTPNFQLI